MHTPRALNLTLALLPFAPLAAAADLRVEVANAVAPGTSQTRITGDPGRAFALFISATEAPTPLGELITLDVSPIRQFTLGIQLLGTLDANGQASYSFTTAPNLAGTRLSFQAASFRPTPQVSNLCRATFLASNSFGALPAQAVQLLGDAFPLADGRVLLLGGSGPLAQVYDPCLQEIQPAGLASIGNLLAARVQLADGRVLVCGGLGVDGQPVADAWVFDPATGTAALVAPLATPRAGAAGVLLPSGRVLVTGGMSSFSLTNVTTFFDGILATSEVFDPQRAAFTAGPAMPERKAFHTASRLQNGAVLVAGGLGVVPILNVPFISNLGYATNAAATSFSPLPKVFATGRMLHSATGLADGRVLIAGGVGADLSGVIKSGDLTQIALETVPGTSIYSTSGLGSFSSGPALAAGRVLHTATRLASGAVLVAGGISGTLDLGAILGGKIELPAAVASSELWTASAVSAGPDLSAPRSGACAAALGDGRVALFGGGPLDVEVYQP